MAAQIWKNNFDSMLAVAAGTGDTTLRLASSATALLGSLTGGDWMILTCYKRSGSVESDIEIVKVTNVDPNSGGDCILTVVRAQEGTVAKAYLAGDPVSMRLTAGGLNATASDSELAAHTGDIANPHAVTKTQVGLGSVDNTSDASKPVSTLQQTALDLKVATSSRDAINGIPGLTVLKLNLRNAANTITSWFTNAATVARTWTMPDKDGTVALTSDITGTNSNTNTGDETTATIKTKLGITTLSGSNTGDQTSVTGSSGSCTGNAATATTAAACSGNAATASILSAAQQTNLITGRISGLAMTLSDTSQGSFTCRASGTGDANLAGLTFYNDSYALKLGIRSDGSFGLGGWSRAAWSWYSDPSGNMVAAGNITAYSDPRLKENIVPISNALDLVSKLDGVRFTWKHGFTHTEVKAGKQDIGVLADQVEAIFPEIVVDSIEIEGEKYKTVCYEKLAPVLIEAIKELRIEINQLKAK